MKITKDDVLKLLRRDRAENQLAFVESYVERFPEYEGAVRLFFACQELGHNDDSNDDHELHGENVKNSQGQQRRTEIKTDADNDNNATCRDKDSSNPESASSERINADVPQTEKNEFEELRKIGEGGMGTVYEALDVKLDRRVAIKIVKLSEVPKELQEEFAKRFEREAIMAAKLNHENIATIYRYASLKDQKGRSHNVIVMQLINGVDLRKLIAAKIDRLTARPKTHKDTKENPCIATLVSKSSSPRWVAKIVMQVANALEYASRQNILHRDIKPANLMVDEQDKCKILDFGLAKPLFTPEGMETLTQSAQFIGTLRYLAPEAAKGKFSPASDVYSLGLTLYELLTLEPAFGATTIFELADQVKKGKLFFDSPSARKIPAPLVKIIKKATRFNPKKRLSARAFSRELERYINRPKRLFIEALIVTCIGLALLPPIDRWWIKREIENVTQDIEGARRENADVFISGINASWLIPKFDESGQQSNKNSKSTPYSIFVEGQLRNLGVVKKENNERPAEAVELFRDAYGEYIKQLDDWLAKEQKLPPLMKGRVTNFIDEDIIKPMARTTTYRLRQPLSLLKSNDTSLSDSENVLEIIEKRLSDDNASEQPSGRLRYRFLFAETELMLSQAYYQARLLAVQRTNSSSDDELANFLYHILFESGSNTYALLKDRPDAFGIPDQANKFESNSGESAQQIDPGEISGKYDKIRTLWRTAWPYRDFDPRRFSPGKSLHVDRSLVDDTSDDLFYAWDFNVSEQALILAIEYQIERSGFLLLTNDYDAAIASIDTAQKYLDRYERYLDDHPEGAALKRDKMLGVILGNYYYMARSIAYCCKLRDSLTHGDTDGVKETLDEIEGSYVNLRETIDRGYEFNHESGEASELKGNLFNEYHLFVVELRMIYLARELKKLTDNAQNLDSYCSTLDEVKGRYNLFIDRGSQSLEGTNYEYHPPVWDKPIAQSESDAVETNDDR